MDRQAVGVHHRVNLARQASSRATQDILVIVVRDAAQGAGAVHLERKVERRREACGAERPHCLGNDEDDRQREGQARRDGRRCGYAGAQPAIDATGQNQNWQPAADIFQI